MPGVAVGAQATKTVISNCFTMSRTSETYNPMTPLIPYQFDPPSEEYLTEHLTYEESSAGTMVSWPLVGAGLLLEQPSRDDLKKVVALNQGRFRHYGLSGFSLGTYHEFLITMPSEKCLCFKMGRIEVTFGQATPLAAMLFEPYHRSKWFGPWELIMSIRINGAAHDEAEIAFINAMAAYEAKFNTLPHLYSLDFTLLQFMDDEADEGTYEQQVLTHPPMITNLEPLRFFFRGLSQIDDIAACIYFYRTLEYFSFFTNAVEMRRLRHDSSISDAEFSRNILGLVSRDERGPIFKLITDLANDAMLKGAVVDGLIEMPSSKSLSEAVYTFRNSIVHGKFSYGYSLQSGPVLDEDIYLPKWKALLRNLARRALDQYGSKQT